MHAAQLKVARRRRERTFAGGWLFDRAEIAKVQRVPGDGSSARRTGQEPGRHNRADVRGRYPRQGGGIVMTIGGRSQRTYGHAAAVGSQAELAVTDQRTSPGGLEPLLWQKTTVVAAGNVQDAVVGRAEHRVRHDEAPVGRPGDLAQRTTAAGVRSARAQDLLQKF